MKKRALLSREGEIGITRNPLSLLVSALKLWLGGKVHFVFETDDELWALQMVGSLSDSRYPLRHHCGDHSQQHRAIV